MEAEFVRITAAPLVPRLLAQLDQYSDQLIKVFKKKGGAAGKKIRQILAPATQVRYSVDSKILWRYKITFKFKQLVYSSCSVHCTLLIISKI